MKQVYQNFKEDICKISIALGHTHALNKAKALVFAICLTFTILITMSSYAQTASGSWTYIQTIDKVKFYYQKASCNGHDVILLKIINENDEQINGSWRLTIQDGTTKQQFIGAFMDLGAWGTKEGSCTKPQPHLEIPHKFTGAGLKLSVEAKVIH